MFFPVIEDDVLHKNKMLTHIVNILLIFCLFLSFPIGIFGK